MTMEEIIAVRRFFLPCIFFFSLSAISSIMVCSQQLSPGSTSSLDVSASLDAATSAVSFHPHQRHPDQHMREGGGGAQSSSSSSSSSTYTQTITLDVHSRDFIPFPIATSSHTDYRSLTLARLRRDSARVEAITSRVARRGRAVHLKHVTGIQGPIVSGTSQGTGEYLSRMGIGTPARPQYMVLDTGSDITWVQCQPCRDCYQQSDPVFDPSASTSYTPLPCTSDRCRSLDVSGCRNTSSCIYEVTYGDGSTTVGDFANETLTLGDSAPVSGVALGCGHDNEGLFVGASGILGLGGGALSFPSQISARSISYCMVDRDAPAKTSTLQLGFANEEYEDGSATVTAPLLRNEKMDTFYYLGMSGISVGGEMLPIPPSALAMDESEWSGGVIVDSGTLVTRLRNEAYAAVRDAFAKGTRYHLAWAPGVKLFDTCYNLWSLRKKVVEVPAVSFHFTGGGELKLPAKNYLIPVDSAGTFCFGFAPTNSSVSIVGNVQLQGTRVTIDRESATVRFTIDKC